VWCVPPAGDDDEWRQWQAVGDPVVHIELRRWADAFVIAPLSGVCTYGVFLRSAAHFASLLIFGLIFLAAYDVLHALLKCSQHAGKGGKRIV
jgi:inner membrane protein involved in colicin E2 resistance